MWKGAALTLNTRRMTSRELKAAIVGFAKERELRNTEWIILECSGTRAGQECAFGLLNHGGTLCVVGFTMDKVEIRLSNLMAFHARAIGNWGCPPELYPKALELVLDGRVKVTPFIEKHPLNEINQVFEAAHAGALAVPLLNVGARAPLPTPFLGQTIGLDPLDPAIAALAAAGYLLGLDPGGFARGPLVPIPALGAPALGTHIGVELLVLDGGGTAVVASSQAAWVRVNR